MDKIIPPFITGVLGLLAGLWLVSYKLRQDIYLDVLSKRLVALQNFLFLVDIIIECKKINHNLPSAVQQKLIDENLPNAILIPKALRNKWYKIWPHLINLSTGSAINKLQINVQELTEISSDIKNYSQEIYEQIDLLEGNFFSLFFYDMKKNINSIKDYIYKIKKVILRS